MATVHGRYNTVLETRRCSLEHREAAVAKLVPNPLDKFFARWLSVFKLVFQSESLPLVTTHLMERKHFDSLNRCERGRVLCDRFDVLPVIRKTRNKNKANPYGLIHCGNSSPEGESWL